jgi:hypothetical protein
MEEIGFQVMKLFSVPLGEGTISPGKSRQQESTSEEQIQMNIGLVIKNRRRQVLMPKADSQQQQFTMERRAEP